MKILVPVKRVVDYNVKVRIKPDGSGVDVANVKMSMNPFDEIAIEEALRLREKGVATEVIIATIGPVDAQAHIRNGLAMGANRAIHVVCDQSMPPLTVEEDEAIAMVVALNGAAQLTAGPLAEASVSGIPITLAARATRSVTGLASGRRATRSSVCMTTT